MQNTEINGEESWIAAAKFLDNGQCGYVLKPPVMMDVERFDPNCPDRWANPHSNIKSLTVEVGSHDHIWLCHVTNTSAVLLDY
jgi:hypothetical protein